MPVIPDQSRIIAQRYRIDDKLGAGGMGTVWRGWDTSLERPVAIKEVVIPAGVPHADAQRLRDRYMREARAAARLRHPNVVAVYDMIAQPPDEHNRHGGVVWTVMELVKARDLSAIIAQHHRLAPPIVARLGLQLATALTAAHTSGVLHRDVKPANVLVSIPPGEDITTDSAAARVVLTDFGISSITGDPSLTRTGQLIGSPSYLAPERLSTRGDVGPAGDLWALGCTLYAAIEGRPPFYGDDPFVVMAAVMSHPVPPPTYAGALTSLLRGLLDKNPAHRWDADRTIAALHRIINTPEPLRSAMSQPVGH
ncbi:MAG: serine/threonine-protein kinase, partial [Mycobacteriales bacterium]